MQPEASPDHPALDAPERRVVVLGALTALGGATLAACGSGGAATQATTSAGAAGAAAAGSVVVKLADVPVGGSVVATGADGAVAVAQPAAGQVVAHSAICTHAGCKVQADGARLSCLCHGSAFDAFTGAVLRGPAKAPLAAVAVKVSGQDVVAD